MSSNVRFVDLPAAIPFGKVVLGVDWDNVMRPKVRERILFEFERSGLLIFDEIEASDEILVAVSEIFGPLKPHPVQSVNDRAALKKFPGVINLVSGPDQDQQIVEINGKLLANWLPWHFDLPYNDEITRATLLTALVIAPNGGQTGFADGIFLYRTLPDDLRKRIDGCNVVYTMDLRLSHMRFGKPAGLREVRMPQKFREFSAQAERMPRAVHPAVWTRATGEKVLHIATLQSVGIEGQENPEGDALLQAVCEHVNGNSRAYFHDWRPNQIVAWDNWRMMHCVTGIAPSDVRLMHRTTVQGDYGLGYFEGGDKGGSVLEYMI